MANPRQRFERFCFKHRNKGIPNLMLYVSLGSALVYLFTMFSGNRLVYEWLCFDFDLILRGQVWRLFTFVLTPNVARMLLYPPTLDIGDLLLTAISLICYFSLGRAMENVWGTLRFNLYYLTGILMMDVYGMILGFFLGEGAVLLTLYMDISHVNMSLFLGYATLYPDAYFLLLHIIPVKAWVFALVDLILVAVNVIVLPFPINMLPLIALANYFLFFGKDVVNVLPQSWRYNASRLFRKRNKKAKGKEPKVVPFPSAGSYQATVATVKAPHTHQCRVCGRTDVSDPDLEFRYCSRCHGYHCYCQDHIGNHEHITE